MEDLGWERNTWFPWSNINHHQQEAEESFIFGSENIFLNPTQKPDSTVCLNPINTTTVTSLESLDCLLSTTNSTADTTSDHDDGISVIFPDYNSLQTNIVNNVNGVSSGEYSVTKEINPVRSKRARLDPGRSTINFRQGTTESDETDSEAIAQMKEMIYREAAFRPVSFAEEEVVKKPRRKNVRISSDPQTVAARQRREKISERIRVLQKLVPGGTKMDTASMLDEAANYLKFLRSQVKALEQVGTTQNIESSITLGVPFPMQSNFLVPRQHVYPNVRTDRTIGPGTWA